MRIHLDLDRISLPPRVRSKKTIGLAPLTVVSAMVRDGLVCYRCSYVLSLPNTTRSGCWNRAFDIEMLKRERCVREMLYCIGKRKDQRFRSPIANAKSRPTLATPQPKKVHEDSDQVMDRGNCDKFVFVESIR